MLAPDARSGLSPPEPARPRPPAPGAPRPRLRDRLLASPRFRDWAARFPLTRGIARREAAALFDLVGGFVYSQVLMACVQLDLFERLAAGPMGTDALASALGLPRAGCERLLAAAAALRLVEQRRGHWALGPLGAVVVGNPAIVAMVQHHAALYADLADPLALLRGEVAQTQLRRFWSYADTAAPNAMDATRVDRYSALMAASQPLVAGQVLDAVDFGGWRRLMDVGGGEGAFVGAVARRVPRIGLAVFDLPPVAERARARLAAQGLAERVEVLGGDFLQAPLPRGADVISLVRVLHDHDDAPAQQLLAAIHAALPPGGALLLAEPMAGTPSAPRMGDAYFGFYLLAMGQGRPRSAEVLTAMLRQAGFEQVAERPTAQPLQTRVLMARKSREGPSVNRA